MDTWGMSSYVVSKVETTMYYLDQKIVMLCDLKFISQARIKKIMQADEDVGKIAMAVPLLVCMCIHVSSRICAYLPSTKS